MKGFPACIYGMPEIAMVGITEDEAKLQRFRNYKVSKFPISANGKSLADGETEVSPSRSLLIINMVNYLVFHIPCY